MDKDDFNELLLEFIEKRVNVICDNLEFKNQFYKEVIAEQKDIFDKINSELEILNKELCGLLKEYLQNTAIVIAITNNEIYRQGVVDGIWLLEQ